MDAPGTPERSSDPGGSIPRRIEAWRRTGDLGRLWPDVTAVELLTAHARVLAATQAVLAATPDGPRTTVTGAAADTTPATVASLPAHGEREARALGIAAFVSGMGPLLAWWVGDGSLAASAEARAVLTPHLDHGRRRSTLLREQLVRLVRAMRGEGIDPVVLKGLHTGAAVFPHPSTRPAADIDLLVRPHERAGAVAALQGAGFTEARRTRFARRSEWTPPGPAHAVRSLELEHADDPWTVDLHTSLERWYFRGLRRGLGDGPFTRTRGMAIGGETVRCLGQPDLTAFLALHASYELVKVRLVRVVELVLVIRPDRADPDGGAADALDWSRLQALLARTGTARFVHPALSLAERLAPGTVPPDLLARTGHDMTRRATRVLAAVLEADMGPLMHPSLDAKLMWARGPREWLLNLSELLVPSDRGLPVGWARLQWRRIASLVRGDAAWRAGREADTMDR
jgi:hypothetical protein